MAKAINIYCFEDELNNILDKFELTLYATSQRRDYQGKGYRIVAFNGKASSGVLHRLAEKFRTSDDNYVVACSTSSNRAKDKNLVNRTRGCFHDDLFIVAHKTGAALYRVLPVRRPIPELSALSAEQLYKLGQRMKAADTLDAAAAIRDKEIESLKTLK